MTAGMATVAGSIMVALVTLLEGQFDESTRLIQHFNRIYFICTIAIIYSNIMIPSNDVTDFDSDKAPKIYESTMDAITRGTSDGLNIAMNVGAILIAFIALVYIVDAFLGLSLILLAINNCLYKSFWVTYLHLSHG